MRGGSVRNTTHDDPSTAVKASRERGVDRAAARASASHGPGRPAMTADSLRATRRAAAPSDPAMGRAVEGLKTVTSGTLYLVAAYDDGEMRPLHVDGAFRDELAGGDGVDERLDRLHAFFRLDGLEGEVLADALFECDAAVSCTSRRFDRHAVVNLGVDGREESLLVVVERDERVPPIADIVAGELAR